MSKGRVLIAKVGLDGHDRGARLLTRLLMEAGFEVIYTGLRQSPEAIANAANQEDVDLVGISILSGSHMTLVPKVIDLLKARQLDDVPVLVGGVIPEADEAALKEKGVAGVVGSRASSDEIVALVERMVARKRLGEAARSQSE